MRISVVYEGDTDRPYLEVLLGEARLEIGTAIDCGGKDRLDAELPSYDAAAAGSPWLVLRDLDHDAPCAAAFVRSRLPDPSPWLCFRLAVRELEAWVLADHEAAARFLRVQPQRLPLTPDLEPDPTRVIVGLARASTSANVRKAMVPRRGSSAPVGPEYEAALIEFGRKHWSPVRASARSPSLERARRAISKLSTRWSAYCNAGVPEVDEGRGRRSP